MHYVHKKARCGPKIAIYRTKTFNFFLGDTFKFADNDWIGRAQGPWSSILLLVTVVSEKCWKETQTEETIGVFGEISIGEEALLPPRLHLCSKWGKQKTCLQIFREVSGVFQRNFNCSKNSAVLEPRTGQFSRTWGFEAKAKDLTFEAKAKDFKMCPRGQGRPQGLHLCYSKPANSSTDNN